MLAYLGDKQSSENCIKESTLFPKIMCIQISRYKNYRNMQYCMKCLEEYFHDEYKI